MARMDETLPAVLFVLAFLALFFFRRILPFIRRAGELRKSEQKAPAVVSIVTFFGLARTNAPTSQTHIIIDRCEGCHRAFDPPRIAAGEYVADDLMQHFCAPECCDRIVELCLPFYYHRGRNASHDPTLTSYLRKHYGDDYPGLEQVVKTEIRKWDKKRKEETEKVANGLRETIRERYQRKAGLEVQPRPVVNRSDVSDVTFSGSERINPPPDGGCRRGYCYACGGEIAVLTKIIPNKDPTLPRGDTFWFCSSFCYTRTLRAWVPFGYRYEPDDDETRRHDDETARSLLSRRCTEAPNVA